MRKRNKRIVEATYTRLDQPTRRPRRRGLSLTTAFTVVALAAAAAFAALAKTDDAGLAGVVTAKAAGMALACGDQYDPTAPVAFAHGLPCGSLLRLHNAANGAEVIATVVGPAMFGMGQGRVADVSPAAAKALGMNETKLTPLVARPLVGTLPGLKQMLPIAPSLASPVFNAPLNVSRRDLDALTRNMLGECGICSPLGKVAVAQVTQNRAQEGFRGETTLFGVVFDDAQFSWTLPGQPKPPTKGKSYADAQALAKAFLGSRLAGNALAVQYLVSERANHYYAFDAMRTPHWGKRGGQLEVVPMDNTIEVELWHRFYREKLPAEQQVATN